MSRQQQFLQQLSIQQDRRVWRVFDRFESLKEAQLAARVFASVGVRTMICPVPKPEAEEALR